MTAYTKYTAAKLVYILENLDHFTTKQVMCETYDIVDDLEFHGEEIPVEMLGGFKTLTMAIQKIKCADC